MCEDDLEHFCKMSVIFYIVNLYICVCMTCSTSYCLYDTLMYPWNKYVCVCVGKKYVHAYKEKILLQSPPPQARPTEANYLPFHGINLWQKDSSSKIFYVLLQKKHEHYSKNECMKNEMNYKNC